MIYETSQLPIQLGRTDSFNLLSRPRKKWESIFQVVNSSPFKSNKGLYIYISIHIRKWKLLVLPSVQVPVSARCERARERLVLGPREPLLREGVSSDMFLLFLLFLLFFVLV